MENPQISKIIDFFTNLKVLIPIIVLICTTAYTLGTFTTKTSLERYYKECEINMLKELQECNIEKSEKELSKIDIAIELRFAQGQIKDLQYQIDLLKQYMQAYKGFRGIPSIENYEKLERIENKLLK